MRRNNTASFYAENVESVQENNRICIVNAILAYVLNLILQQSSLNLLEIIYRYFKKKMVGHDPPLTSWKQELAKIFQTLCDGGDRKIKKIIDGQIHYNYNICRHHGLLHLYDEAQDDHICKDLPQIAEVAYLFVLLVSMSQL